MARRRSSDGSLLDGMMEVAILGVGGYFAYDQALAGSLGPTAQQYAQKIQAWLNSLFGGGGGGGGGNGTCANPTGSLLDMMNANPTFVDAMLLWQDIRISQGLDRYDWGAFRQWLAANNYVDPGPNPCPQFCGNWGD